MKKLITSVVAGLVLMAGQAVANSDSAVVRVGDRVGSESKADNQLFGANAALIIVLGAAAATGIILLANHHHDHPHSP